MQKITMISCVLIILLLISCNDNSDNPVGSDPLEYDTLISLNVGNYWLYLDYYLNDDGSVDSSVSPIGEFGFIIHSPPTQSNYSSNYTNYQMSMCEEDLTPVDDSYYLTYGGSKMVYENENGFYYSGIVRADSVVMTFNDLIFPYPAEEGDSADGHVFYYSTAGNYLNVSDELITQYKCVSTDSSFTTPLGDFNCIVYKMAYYDIEPVVRSEVYYFIKPGLGIVGMVNMKYRYNRDEYTYFMKYVLTDYHIE